MLALLLRFWNLFLLPYTHDELSALMRLQPSLGGTIEHGVIELDTHPPGVQVFEWCWTRLFGMNEAVVKLPFILLSCAALFFLYRFGLAWTSPGTTLISIALLATLQYSVLYAQIARPYAAGFFTVALLVDQLTRHLAHGRRATLVWTGIAIVLCAYVHHFTLLLAFVITLSGLLLVTPDKRRGYLLMCLCALLAYLPNIPIFLKQLRLGGLGGWLPPPGADWLPDHIRWILHFSPVLAAVVAGTLGLALLQRIRTGAAKGPAKWHILAWGLSPLLIGMAYSIWRAPVLQYSMLLFSFPFILFAAFGGARELGKPAIIMLTATLATVSAMTLVLGRKHYAVFRDSPYAAMVRLADEEVRANGRDGVLVLFDAPRPQVEFHVRRRSLDQRVAIHWLREEDPSAVEGLLSDARFHTVVLGTSNGHLAERIAQVQARYPFTIAVEDHVEGQVRVMRRSDREKRMDDRRLIAVLSPSRRGGRTAVDPDMPMVHDGNTRTSSWDMGGHEYGLELSVELGTMDRGRSDLFEAELMASRKDSLADLLLVFELRQADSTLIYRASAAVAIADTMFITAALSPSWVGDHEGRMELKAFAWNRSRKPVLVDHLRIYRREGNPIQDGLLSPVLGLGHRPASK